MQDSNEQQIADLRKPNAEGIIVIDYACSKCQYNLRSLHTSANCPECGTAISQTVKHTFFPALKSDSLQILKDIKDILWLQFVLYGVVFCLLYGIASSSLRDVEASGIGFFFIFFFGVIAIATVRCTWFLKALDNTPQAPSLRMLPLALHLLVCGQLICFWCLYAAVVFRNSQWQYVILVTATLLNFLFIWFNRKSLYYVRRCGFRMVDINKRRAGMAIRMLLLEWSLLGLVIYPLDEYTWLIMVLLCQLMPLCVILTLFDHINFHFMKAAFEFSRTARAAVEGKPFSDSSEYFQLMTGHRRRRSITTTIVICLMILLFIMLFTGAFA